MASPVGAVGNTPGAATGETCTNLLLILWPTLYFVYIGTWEARFVRHTLPLVPFVCLFAAGALSALLHWSMGKGRILGACRGHRGGGRNIQHVVGARVSCIYASTDTRLAATAWFHANVPAGTSEVVEDKDTLVPIPDLAHSNTDL